MDENTFLWKLAHLWWILISFIFLLNGLGLLYAGFKADERLWKLEGIIYEVIVVIFVLLANIYPSADITSLFTYIYLLSWFISIVRSFWIRNQFLEKISHEKYNNSRYRYEAPPDYDNTSLNYKQHNPIDMDYGQMSENPHVEDNNQTNNQIEERTNDTSNNKVVDINKASAEELAQLPGINLIKAKKIIQLRQSGTRIKSTNDLKVYLELNDYQIQELKEHIVISDNMNNNQRKIDF